MIMVSFRIERTGQVEVRLKVEGIARRFSAVVSAQTGEGVSLPLPSKIPKSATSCLVAGFFFWQFCESFKSSQLIRSPKYRKKYRNYITIKVKLHIKILYIYLQVKFIYSEKATKFCEIFTSHLSYVVTVRIYEL